MKIFRLSWWLTPLIGYKWVRARDLAVLYKYKDCLSNLASIKRMRGPDIRPMGQWTTEYYIFQGHCYYALGEKNKAIESFNLAFQEMAQPNKYSPEEKDYLSVYITAHHDCPELVRDKPVDLEKIDLDYVNSELKLYFPLQAHPMWPKPAESGDDDKDELEA